MNSKIKIKHLYDPQKTYIITLKFTAKGDRIINAVEKIQARESIKLDNLELWFVEEKYEAK